MKIRALLGASILLLASCGGGGDGSSSSPVLSNLNYSPARIDFGSRDIPVSILVGVFDAEGDIIGYNAVDSLGNDLSDSLGNDLSDPLNTNNITEGTVFIQDFLVSTAAVGDYSITFFAIDSAGNQSNKLTMNFQILLAVNAGADKVSTTGSAINLESNQVIGM
jgi:hypothetical protein